jgi:predicted Zn-dependent protease
LAGDLPEAEPGPIVVALGPWAVARLLARLVPALDQASRDREADPTSSGPLLMDSRINLNDDPTVPGAPGSRAFDDRGAEARPVALIRAGRWVDGRILRGDPRAALRGPTGHDGLGEVLPGQLVMAPGSRSLVAAAADRRRPVLWVEDLNLEDVSVDTRRAEIRMTVDAPVVLRGQWLSAARRRTLAGPWSSVLGRVLDVASDLERVDGIDAAGLLLDGLVLGPVGEVDPGEVSAGARPGSPSGP